ncbi:MAG TPA: hypothetical protein VL996_10890 [Methylocella sp.]|nr:hypothetical protein [Methylocella sp.]
MKWNLFFCLLTRRQTAAVLTGICLTLGQSALAQQAKTGGSPLDTLMQTKLWADVPEAKDFVRDTRPPPDSLAYQPVTGIDPERPKPRSKDELQALQGELERAVVHNEGAAQKRLGFKKPKATASQTAKRD